MSLAVDPLWGSVTPPCAGAVCGAFSSRTQSSGQGQCPALSCGQPRDRAPRPDAVSRTAWGTPEILHARSRMSFLTLRVKNVLLVNALLLILFLSDTYGGRVHDKRIADATPYPLPAKSR